MALGGCRGDAGHREIAREFAMQNSSASAVLLLPFGALTGVIPIDSVQRERVLGDFSNILAGLDNRLVEPVVGDPFGSAVSAIVDGGGKSQWK